MKYRIATLLVLFVLLLSISSCFAGRWARYGHKSHYDHRRHYQRFHNRRNGDW